MTDAISRYPLQWPDGWPRVPVGLRKRAKFKQSSRQYSTQGPGSWLSHKSLSVADGTERVLAELGRFGVLDGDAVISTNLAVRLDGLPRSNQGEPTDPGVAVYWQTATGERKVMAVDIYDRVADNLAAVAATLDAMRAIERHGGAQILERAFTGFDALPPPRDPFRLLGLSRQHATEASISAAFRSMARTAHPDSPTGSHNQMADLTWARDEALKIVKART